MSSAEVPPGDVPAAAGPPAVARGGTFASLAIRNFRLFFVGQAISQVGNWLTLIAQTLLVLHLGGSGLQVGLLTACQFLPILLLGAWAGLVADRSDKRRLLLVVQSLAMVQSFVLAALAFSGDPPIWSLYLVALAGGLATAFDNPTRRSFVVEMVPEDLVANAVSLNTALMTGSRVIGPALAGLLVQVGGFGWCFTVDGISYVAVLWSLWRMAPAELRSAPVTTRAKGQVREGLRYIRSDRVLWLPLAMMAIIGTFTFNFQVTFPLFVKDALGRGDTTFTILFSVVSIGSVLSALAAARRREVQVRAVVVAAAAFGASMLVMAVAPNLISVFVAGCLVGAASVAFMTACTAIVQLRSIPTMRGRVLAIQAMLMLGSTPIGGPVLGWVCDTFGSRTGVALGGVAALAAAAYGFVVDEKAKRLDAGPTVLRGDEVAAVP